MTADDTETQRVEAAAEAIWQEQGYGTHWSLVHDQRREGMRILARAALTAARAAGDDLAAERAVRERVAQAIETAIHEGWWHGNEDISAKWEGGIKAGLGIAAGIARTNPGEGGAE